MQTPINHVLHYRIQTPKLEGNQPIPSPPSSFLPVSLYFSSPSLYPLLKSPLKYKYRESATVQ